MKALIGIDPDVEKSGVASIYKGELHLSNMSFPELINFLRFHLNKELDLVVIEAGWLNKSNWHANKNDSVFVSCKKGYGVGRNHQVGILIAEICKYNNIPFEVIRPTNSKVDSKTFNRITGHVGRTNQEQRDAAMLILGRMV